MDQTREQHVLLLALHGQAYAGKDEGRRLLRAMAELSGSGVKVIEARFAEPIYRCIAALDNSVTPFLSKEGKERPRQLLGDLSVRQFAVGIGEGVRSYNDSSWVKILQASAAKQIGDALTNEGHDLVLVLVPDMRKEQERAGFYELANEICAGWIFPACQAMGTVLHLKGVNGPKNPNPNPATETELHRPDEEPLVVNNHSEGKKSYALGLWGALLDLPGEFKPLVRKIFHPYLDLGAVVERAEQIRLAEEGGAR